MKNQAANVVKRSFVGKALSKYGVYIAFIVLFIILSIASDVFLTWTNIINIFKQISVIGVIAVGMTFVIATGGIDLSVGAVLACSACLATSLSQEGTAQPLGVALIVGLLIGVACGAFSGVFIAWFDVPAFIATLGTMTIVRGIVYVYTNGYPITDVTDTYKFIGRGDIGGIPFSPFGCVFAALHKVWSSCIRSGRQREVGYRLGYQHKKGQIHRIHFIRPDGCDRWNTVILKNSDWPACRWRWI